MAIKSLADLRDTPSPAWIWDGMLLPAGLTLLSAYPKVGKTTFIAYLLRAMWTEAEYIGRTIRSAPTLVISEEADTLIAARADALGFSEMWPIGWLTPEPGRTWEHLLAYIQKYAMLYHNPLIVVDTLSRHWGIDDENDNAKVERALNPLIDIARTAHAAILLVHHTRKSGGAGGVASRGGSAIVGAVDIILELGRVAKEDRSPRRKLEGFSRYAETPGQDEPLVIQLAEDGYHIASGEEVAAGGTASTVRQWLLMHDGWWTADSVAAASGISLRTVRDALGQLLIMDEVSQRGSGKKNHPYVYSCTEEETT